MKRKQKKPNADINIKSNLNKMHEFEKMLKEEKIRRNQSKNKIIFVSAVNIANMYWCQQSMIFKCKSNELSAFSSYIKIKKEIGKDLSLKSLNKLINKKAQKIKKYAKDLSFSNFFKEFDIRLNVSEKDDLLKGQQIEIFYSQRLPSIGYYFNWNDYVILTQPDGISDDFCYEFKAMAKKYYFNITGRIASAQAQIYSYFFKRPEILVELYAIDKDEVIKIKKDADYNQTNQMFNTMDLLLQGKINPLQPEEWKCKKCTFLKECKISLLKK